MSVKRYKCPFCDDRESRDNLAKHLSEEHEELIPAGMSPNQLAFNTINNKKETYGVCVVCKRPTEWNENSCKYNRLCGRESCRKALRDMYKKNMVKVYGKTTLLNDPEHQERMLAHRHISGVYRFKDGGRHTYTGSYEHKTLEFLDQVMNFHSSDILSPGPILEYTYQGKPLKWITDILIIPLNLIIEVKDGGDNKNNSIDDNVRGKTLAKEEMITNLGKFHYLRLTNNNFEQLLQIIAEIKLQMVDDTKDNKQAIIRVHEEVESLTEGVLFDDDTRFYRYDEWVKGKVRVLFICGYSGGGKSTLSENLANEFSCPVVHLDGYGRFLRTVAPEIFDLKKQDRKLYHQKSIEYAIKKQYPTGRLIIEGVQVAFAGPEAVRDHACIMLGTSVLKASYRAHKREMEDPDRLKDLFPDDPEWKLALRRNTQFFNRAYVNYGQIKPYFDEFIKGTQWNDLDPVQEAFGMNYSNKFDYGAVLDFYEFEEAKNQFQKACIADPEFKWELKRSWYNESALICRIDYTCPDDVGAGLESNWQELDSYLRDYLFPRINGIGNFIYRAQSDSSEIGFLDIFARSKEKAFFPANNQGFRYEENPPWIKTYKKELGLPVEDEEPGAYDALGPQTNEDFIVYGTNNQVFTVASNESTSITESGNANIYSRKYRNFDEFCKYINTPEEVYNWYMYNKVEWPDAKGKFLGNNKPFAFPDDIVRTHIGNCWDHSNFMAMFCERKGIEFMPLHAIEYCVSKRASKPEWWAFGHVICAFKTEGLGWRLFDYHGGWGKVISSLTGPWPTIRDTIKAYKEIYGCFGRMMGNPEYYKRSDNIVYEYMFAYDIWKKFYNDHSIKQEDLIPMIMKHYIKYHEKYWDTTTNSLKDYHFEDPFDMINMYAQKTSYQATQIWPKIIKDKIKNLFKEDVDVYKQSDLPPYIQRYQEMVREIDRKLKAINEAKDTYDSFNESIGEKGEPYESFREHGNDETHLGYSDRVLEESTKNEVNKDEFLKTLRNNSTYKKYTKGKSEKETMRFEKRVYQELKKVIKKWHNEHGEEKLLLSTAIEAAVSLATLGLVSGIIPTAIIGGAVSAAVDKHNLSTKGKITRESGEILSTTDFILSLRGG